MMIALPHGDWDIPSKVCEVRTSVADIIAADPELAAWCDDACVRRFLRAHQGHASKASRMLRNTLVWRQAVRPAEQRCPICIKEPFSHSLRIVGFDTFRQPVIYTCFSQAYDRHGHPDEVLQHVIYELEKAAKILQAQTKALVSNAERWVVFVDFAGYSWRDNHPKPGVALAKLLNHYPDRLASIVLYGAPSFFDLLWRMIRHLLNEETKAKVRFVLESSQTESAFNALGLGTEMTQWLQAECAENRLGPSHSGTEVTPEVKRNAKRYWTDVDASGRKKAHDPRGTTSYKTCPWFELTYDPDASKKASLIGNTGAPVSSQHSPRSVRTVSTSSCSPQRMNDGRVGAQASTHCLGYGVPDVVVSPNNEGSRSRCPSTRRCSLLGYGCSLLSWRRCSGEVLRVPMQA